MCVPQLAVCGTGRPTATASDIYQICSWWVELNDPEGQLQGWGPMRHAARFGHSDPQMGIRAIEKCLQSNSRFQRCGRNVHGEMVWWVRNRGSSGQARRFSVNSLEQQQKVFNDAIAKEWVLRQRRMRILHQKRQAAWRGGQATRRPKMMGKCFSCIRSQRLTTIVYTCFETISAYICQLCWPSGPFDCEMLDRSDRIMRTANRLFGIKTSVNSLALCKMNLGPDSHMM